MARKANKELVADVAPMLVDRATAAKMLGVSLRTVSQWAADGLITRVSRGPGKKTLGFSVESLRKFASGKAVQHGDD